MPLYHSSVKRLKGLAKDKKVWYKRVSRDHCPVIFLNNYGPLVSHLEIMHYVYILKSYKVNELYIGQTNDLKRRFIEHNEKKNISTKHKAPFKLIYYEAYQSPSDAKYREKQLKRHSQAYVALKNRIKNSLA